MKFIIAIVISVCVIGGVYYFITNNDSTNDSTTNTKREQSAESMTAESAKQRATEYWDNTKFSDFSANYELMCDDVKDAVDKATYIQKYELDLEENPLRKPDRIEIGDARIEGNTALVRVTAFTVFYPEGTSTTTELDYANAKWCKKVSQETLDWLQE